MTDAATATGAALFAALDAPDALSIPVYQHVPQDTLPPIAVIGEHRVTAPWGKGDADRQVEVDIIVLFQGEENKPVTGWQAQIEAALDGKVLLSTGFIIHPRLIAAKCELMDDGFTYAGTQTFACAALAD